MEETESIHCILFSEERRKEAFELAKEKREQGFKSYLQDINGVKNLDCFTSKFANTTFLIGKQGKGDA